LSMSVTPDRGSARTVLVDNKPTPEKPSDRKNERLLNAIIVVYFSHHTFVLISSAPIELTAFA
jgi:hypothetical protein